MHAMIFPICVGLQSLRDDVTRQTERERNLQKRYSELRRKKDMYDQGYMWSESARVRVSTWRRQSVALVLDLYSARMWCTACVCICYCLCERFEWLLYTSTWCDMHVYITVFFIGCALKLHACPWKFDALLMTSTVIMYNVRMHYTHVHENVDDQQRSPPHTSASKVIFKKYSYQHHCHACTYMCSTCTVYMGM